MLLLRNYQISAAGERYSIWRNFVRAFNEKDRSGTCGILSALVTICYMYGSTSSATPARVQSMSSGRIGHRVPDRPAKLNFARRQFAHNHGHDATAHREGR